MPAPFPIPGIDRFAPHKVPRGDPTARCGAQRRGGSVVLANSRRNGVDLKGAATRRS
jgi:hypothetical protein